MENYTTAELQAKIFELEYVIEQLPGSIYWKDQAGIYLGRNSYNMQKMHNTKLESHWIKDAVLGKTDYDFFPKETADLYRKHDLQVMQTQQELCIEEPITLPNGATIVQLSSKRPLYNAEGKVVGIIGNTVDITHTKAIENELRQAKQLAEQANVIKTEFMRNMEHDIRTPFNGVLAMANCLHDLEPDLRACAKITFHYDRILLLCVDARHTRYQLSTCISLFPCYIIVLLQMLLGSQQYSKLGVYLC